MVHGILGLGLQRRKFVEVRGLNKRVGRYRSSMKIVQKKAHGTRKKDNVKKV